MIKIRPATEPDLPSLLGLYAELHPDDPPPADAVEVWRRIAVQQGRTILVAESPGPWSARSTVPSCRT